MSTPPGKLPIRLRVLSLSAGLWLSFSGAVGGLTRRGRQVLNICDDGRQSVERAYCDNGTGEVVVSALVDSVRADLRTALGDGGRHAFQIPAEDLPQGPITQAADIRASDQGLAGIALTPNVFSLNCGG